MGKGGFSDRGIRSHTLSLAGHVLMGYPKGIIIYRYMRNAVHQTVKG